MDRVGLSNLALSIIGDGSRLIDPSQDVKAARVIATHYDATRRLVLREHQWNFAMTRAQLTASTTVPAFGYKFQYPLPPDWVRFVERNGSWWIDLQRDRYQLESRAILTDELGPVNIRYIRDEPDLNEWDDLAIGAFAARLAYDIADEMSADLQRKQAAWSEYTKVLADARGVDAIENPPERQVEDSWITARFLP